MAEGTEKFENLINLAGLKSFWASALAVINDKISKQKLRWD